MNQTEDNKAVEDASDCYAHNYFDMHETNNYKALKQGFIAGAKWKTKIMYSEEEVLDIIDKAFHMYASSYRQDAKKWFEQHKKK